MAIEQTLSIIKPDAVGGALAKFMTVLKKRVLLSLGKNGASR